MLSAKFQYFIFTNVFSLNNYLPIILGGPDFHTLVAGKDDTVAGEEPPMAPKGLIVDIGNEVVGGLSMVTVGETV